MSAPVPLPGEARGAYRDRIGTAAAALREERKRARGKNRAALDARLEELRAAWERNRALCATCGQPGTLLVWRAVFGGTSGTAGLMHDTGECKEPKHDTAADAGPAVGPPGALA